MEKVYIAIDLKAFYASVECVERGLDPLTTLLVVADASRTEKTICLAVSPSLKAYGISGRARLFEVVQKVKEVNAERMLRASGQKFSASATDAKILAVSPEMAVGYLTAPPRMSLYMEYSTRIYNIYLKYVSAEDIHVYSIDEVFMDVTGYLKTYQMSAAELARKMIQDVYQETGITATAGIGTNLYLCKVAMDIVAKHVSADVQGVRIAQLDELSYRKLLWQHKPLTDFWRVGRGYAKKLAQNGLYTMEDIARCSIGESTDYYNEELLYQLFGINAELLIDHAWGWEPCTIADIKAYKPQDNSIGTGQVLQYPYTFEKAKLVTMEMTDSLVLELVEKGLVAQQMILTVGYDIENLKNPDIKKNYKGPVTTDFFGRTVPKHAHGTARLEMPTASAKLIMQAVKFLFDELVDEHLLVRRINVTAGHVCSKYEVKPKDDFEQLDLFTDYAARETRQKAEEKALEKEEKMQRAILDIKKKFGKNAILRGMNLEEGATGVQRNGLIGGHKG